MPETPGQWLTVIIIVVAVLAALITSVRALTVKPTGLRWLSGLPSITIGSVTYHLGASDSALPAPGGGYIFGFAQGQIELFVPKEQLPVGYGTKIPTEKPFTAPRANV